MSAEEQAPEPPPTPQEGAQAAGQAQAANAAATVETAAAVLDSSTSAGAAASAGLDSATSALHQHLYKAKALSERLLAVMAQREERLSEIKRRVSLLEPGGESVQPLIEAENNMRDAHNRMKAVLADLGKELDAAGITSLPADNTSLANLPDHSGQGDEVAFLYKHLLLALGEWKAAQKKVASERAATLAQQVQTLREQVAREHAETQRIRQRKEQLEQLRQEKQVELEAIKREPDAKNE